MSTSTKTAGRAYTSSMFSLVRCRALPVVLFALALPMYAQRGGGGASAAARGGAAAGRASSTSGTRGPGAYGAGYAASNARGSSFAGQRSLFPPPGVTSTQPVYYANGIRRYGAPNGGGLRTRAGYNGVGYGFVGYGYPGYVSAGYGFAGDGSLDYADSDAFDPLDPNNYAAAPSTQTAQDAFVYGQPQGQNGPLPVSGNSEAPGADPFGQPAYGQPGEQAPEAPIPYAQPRPARAAPQPARNAAPPPEEDAVTIVFKDGRPPEQIHNYALTRTTLFITGAHTRTIPVEQIDLVATAKANEKSGVDFELPTK